MVRIHSNAPGDIKEKIYNNHDRSSAALFPYGSNNASTLGTRFMDLTYKHAYDLPLDSVSFINDLAVLFSPGSVAVKSDQQTSGLALSSPHPQLKARRPPTASTCKSPVWSQWLTSGHGLAPPCEAPCCRAKD